MPQSRFNEYLNKATSHLPEAERHETRAELEAHLSESARLRQEQGLSHAEAEADALQNFGAARTVNTALVAASVRGLMRGKNHGDKIVLFWQVVLGVTAFALAVNARTTSGMVGIASAPFVFAALPFLAAGVLVGRGEEKRPFVRLALVILSLFLALNVLRIVLVGSWTWARIPTDPIGYLVTGIEWLVEYLVAVPGVLLGLWLKKHAPEQTAQHAVISDG